MNAENAPLAPVFRCGVPECADGVVAGESGSYTLVVCDTHNAQTHWDTVPRAVEEQQIIRVQDGWRQHGTSAPPKR